MAVSGAEGMISYLTGETYVRNRNGSFTHMSILPGNLGLKDADLKTYAGGKRRNAQIIMSILKGESGSKRCGHS